MINSDKVMEKIKWKKEMKLSSEVKSFNFKYSDQGSFPWKGKFEPRLEGGEGASDLMSGRRVIQAEQPTNAKYLRQEYAWNVPGKSGWPVYLWQNEREGKG